jgi:ABC-type Fe3+/spermidine/putrescine transport system ATPase subunit
MNQARIEQVRPARRGIFATLTRFVAGFPGAVNWIGDVGIRTEATKIVQYAKTPPERTVTATVIESVFLGDRIQVLVKLVSGQHATAQVNRSSPTFQPGQIVAICWDPTDEMRLP